MGLGEVRHIGEGNKNIMAFTDHTGTSEASTYELRPNYREQDLPLIHTEDDRMGNAILWANCKYHGFWVQTEQQEFFALFKVVNIRYGSSSYTIPGDRRPTTRADFHLADAEMILLWDGQSFSLASWDGTTLEADRLFLVASSAA
jgi:hypothetical protein